MLSACRGIPESLNCAEPALVKLVAAREPRALLRTMCRHWTHPFCGAAPTSPPNVPDERSPSSQRGKPGSRLFSCPTTSARHIQPKSLDNLGYQPSPQLQGPWLQSGPPPHLRYCPTTPSPSSAGCPELNLRRQARHKVCAARKTLYPCYMPLYARGWWPR